MKMFFPSNHAVPTISVILTVVIAGPGAAQTSAPRGIYRAQEVPGSPLLLPDRDRRGVWRFPVAPDGSLGEGQLFFFTKDLKPSFKDLPPAKDGDDTLVGWIGRIQGLAIDRMGNFYIGGAESHTSGAAVAVISPDGKEVLAMILDVPRNIASLALSGDDRVLYIAGAGEYRLHSYRRE